MKASRWISVAAAAALVLGVAAPAFAGVSRSDYREVKQEMYTVALDIQELARVAMINAGPPADRHAFLEEILNATIGPALPVPQVSLPANCAAAVAPLREQMNKYESWFAIPNKKKAKFSNVVLQDARMGCDEGRSPAWAHFYTQEFEPWFYSQRGNYQVVWNDNGLKLRWASWKKYQDKFGPLCQKLAFDEDGWLKRSSCPK